MIEKQLLFHSGDSVDRALLDETERNLRALPFVKDAKIMEIPVGNNEEDIIVSAQDAWTTQPQINLSSEGGQNHYSAGILEENVLGYGKSASYFYRNDPTGNTNSISYIDPQIGNTRLQLNVQGERSSLGNTETLNFGQPFYSLETKESGGIQMNHTRVEKQLFQSGNQTSAYINKHWNITPNGGIRINGDALNPQRLLLNYQYNEDLYQTLSNTAPGTLPKNVTTSGPNLTWTLTQSNYIKETFIETAERIEDINLGHQVSVMTGYSDRVLGATENSIPFGVADTFGYGGEGPWFGLLTYGSTGRYDIYAHDQPSGKTLNTIYYGDFGYYRHLLPEFPLTGVAHFESAYLQNPQQSNQLSVGGDTGLRGYKVDSFTGNKTMLLNLESRFYMPWEVLHLTYIGGAIFFDAGQAQPENVGFRRQDFHADIGAGFRFALTRSTGGTVFRVDFAYALGPTVQGNRMIISISSGQGFKQTGNTFKGFATANPAATSTTP